MHKKNKRSRLVRVLFSFFIILLFGSIAAILIAPSYINWENNKSFLEEELSSLTGGYDIKLTGPITAKLFPYPEVSAKAIRVLPFEGKEDVSVIEGFNAKFSWKSLLDLKLHTESISASSVVINLIQIDENKTNYEPKRRSRRLKAPSSLYPLENLGVVRVGSVLFTHTNKLTENTYKVVGNNIEINSPSLDKTEVTFLGDFNGGKFNLSGKLDLTSLRQIPVDVSLILDENKFNLKGVAFDPFFRPLVKGKVNFNIESIDNVFSHLDIGTPAELVRYGAIGDIKFFGDVTLGGGSVIAKDFNLSSSEKEVSGQFTYKVGEGDKKRILDILIKAKELDIDEIMEMSTSARKHKSKTTWSDIPFDLSFLEKTNLNVSFKGDNIKLYSRNFESINLKALTNKGMLIIEDSEAVIDDGSIKIVGQLGHSKNPNIEASIKIVQMPLQHLLKTPGSVRFEGRINGFVEISSKGKSKQSMFNNLSGKGKIAVIDGLLLKVDLENTLTAVEQIFKKKKSDIDTPFTDMSLTFNIKEGTLRNDDFYLKSAKNNLKGKGKIDLARWTVNYQAKEDTGTASMSIPVRIIGNLSNPVISSVKTPSMGGDTTMRGMMGSQMMVDSKNPHKLNTEEDSTPELPFKINEATPEAVQKFLNQE